MKKRLVALLILALVMVLSLTSCGDPIGDWLNRINPPEEYAVYFIAGDGVSVPSQTVKEGELVTKPTDPTLHGYEFDGWYKDDAYTTPWNFESDVVKQNTLIYAKWVEHVHVGGTATCTSGPICESCGEEYGEALGHKGGTATCTDLAVCEVCGESYGNTLSHTEEILAAVAPTCTETGLTEGKKCSVCGEILVAQEEVPATGHSFGDWIVDVEPAIGAEGSKHRECACGEIETATIPAIDHTHSYSSEVTTEAGCETDGVRTYTCSCGDSYTEAIPATGHSFGDWIVDVEPTIGAEGSKHRECACGEIETATIPAIDHTHSYSSEVTTAAGCETDGVRTYTCSCGDSYTEAIPATGHTDETIEAVAPTCEGTGLTEGKKCSVCGEILVAQEEVPATGHTEGEAVVENEVKPNCTTAGSYDTVVYCTACDKELSRETTNVDALGHKDEDGDFKCDTCDAIVEPEADSVLTIEEAMALASLFGHDKYTKNKYYIVCEIVNVYNTTYGNFNLKDTDFVIYGLYSADGKTRYDAMTYKPVAGDEITVYGVIGKYNTTLQMKNAWLDDVVAHEHVWSDATCKDLATCSICGGTTGELADHVYENGVCKDCGVAEGVEIITTTVSISDYATANSWVNEKQYFSLVVDENVTITVTYTGTYNNTGKYYSSNKSWRIYQNETPSITFTGAEGVTILTIKITYANKNNGVITHETAQYTTGTTIDVNTNTVSFGVASTKSGTTNGNIQITSIEVVYASAGSAPEHECEHVCPECNKCTDAVCTESVCADKCGGHHVCADGNNDHKCDTCGETLSQCADNNDDHNCDLCGTKLSECADDDRDHECDVCFTSLSECVDSNNNHICDICNVKISSCRDNDQNHFCDLCGIQNSHCININPTEDHDCDWCGAIMTDCADNNDDHNCDVCGEKLSDCNDGNKDHKCDLCGEALTECADNNDDHNCDLCGTKLSECADDDRDHECDVCFTSLSECVDSNNNHICDICNVKISSCRDNDQNHFCDLCGIQNSHCININPTEDHDCDWCGEKVSDCEGGTATCKDKAVCEICGQPYGELGEHNYGEWIVAVPSTCKATGTLGHYACSVCEKNFDIDKNELESLIIDIDPDAHFDGEDENSNCDYCQASLCTEHAWNDGEVVTEATCVTAGSEKFTCTACGTTETRTVNALGHDYSAEWTVDVPATCTEAGSKSHHCSRCDSKSDVTEIPATGHRYGNLVVHSASCTVDGYIEITCGNCNVTFDSREDDEAKQYLIDFPFINVTAKGHDEVSHEAQAATCTEIGWNAYVTCSRCDYTTYEEIDALGHRLENWIQLDPTCTEAGYTAHQRCSREGCGYTSPYFDLAPKGHTAGETVVENNTPATCTDDGSYDNVVYCTVCKVELERKTVTVPAGHKYESVVTAPTCEADGYTTHTCSVCGNIYTSDKTDALGHTEVVDAAVDATCSATGLTEGSHCDACGKVLVAQDVVEKLPHTVVVDKAVEATCTTEGKTEGSHCSVCETVLVAQNTIPAGHTNANNDNYCDVCGVRMPETAIDVTFNLGANGTATHADGTGTATYTETKNGVKLSIVSGTNMYTGAIDAKGNSCIKLGTSSGIGSFSFTVPSNVNKVTIEVAQYKSNTTKVVINGTTHTITTASNDGAYTSIEVDTSSNKTVTITTVDNANRAMVNSISLEGCGHEYNAPVKVDPQCEIEGSITSVCKHCGATAVDTLEATGHTYINGVCSCGAKETDVEFVVPEGIDEVVMGEGNILPSANAPDGYTFAGWSETELEETTETPELLKAGEVYIGTGTTLYAVYSGYKEMGGSSSFVKVTSAPSDWSGTYLIVYEAGKVAFNGAATSLDSVSNTVTVTINSGKISATDTLKKSTFTIAKSGSSYTIKSASGYYIGSTSDKNNLLSNKTTKYTNTISLNSDGSVHIVSSGKAVLRYNASSGQYRFRYYKSGSYSNQKAICLYQLVETAGTVSTYYTILK